MHHGPLVPGHWTQTEVTALASPGLPLTDGRPWDSLPSPPLPTTSQEPMPGAESLLSVSPSLPLSLSLTPTRDGNSSRRRKRTKPKRGAGGDADGRAALGAAWQRHRGETESAVPPTSSPPRDTPRGLKARARRRSCANVHGDIIHYSQKSGNHPKAPRLTHKQTVRHSHTAGHCLATKKEGRAREDGDGP